MSDFHLPPDGTHEGEADDAPKRDTDLRFAASRNPRVPSKQRVVDSLQAS